jgi:hypothetical protein
MTAGQQGLRSVKARVKHMIVLSDGQTTGGGYEALAAQLRQEKITVSTVAVGSGADVGLLQAIAAAGGGKSYHTFDPSAIPRIFTQDAMVHMGKLIREEAFAPKLVERHPMVKGVRFQDVPDLLGYVKTTRKATSQTPLVTDLGDPLLAHWRFGLGRVTAFTSDCKSRWGSLWLTGWPEGYSQFWAQVLRETAREPQGRFMDLHIEERGGRARVLVDLLENPAEYKNQAAVEADVYFVPAQALGSSMKHLRRIALDQEGPGRYSGTFRAAKPGVYLVRARSGADMVSAGLVHNISSEAATGRADLSLLGRAVEQTGGVLLEDPAEGIPTIKLMLLLFLADLVIRRWENITGMLELVRRKEK